MSPDDGEDDKIIIFPGGAQNPQREAFINLPPVTACLVAAFILVYAAMRLFMSDLQKNWTYEHFGFVPEALGDMSSPPWQVIATLFTYMFLHGSLAHLLVNGFSTMAFGAGIERLTGGFRFLLFFTLCGLAAVLTHFLLNLHSTDPVIGASGGISGMFAAILLLLQKQRSHAGMSSNLLPVALIWIVASVLFGLMEAPGGGTVAWEAHIGGFVAGLLLAGPVLGFRQRLPQSPV